MQIKNKIINCNRGSKKIHNHILNNGIVKEIKLINIILNNFPNKIITNKYKLDRIFLITIILTITNKFKITIEYMIIKSNIVNNNLTHLTITNNNKTKINNYHKFNISNNSKINNNNNNQRNSINNNNNWHNSINNNNNMINNKIEYSIVTRYKVNTINKIITTSSNNKTTTLHKNTVNNYKITIVMMNNYKPILKIQLTQKRYLALMTSIDIIQNH